VWIGSADDEGANEADGESGIDGAAGGAEAEHAIAGGGVQKFTLQ